MTKGFTHESTKSQTIKWYTPPEVFDALGIEFDLDPCSPGEGRDFVPAKRRITREQDGQGSPSDSIMMAFGDRNAQAVLDSGLGPCWKPVRHD